MSLPVRRERPFVGVLCLVVGAVAGTAGGAVSAATTQVAQAPSRATSNEAREYEIPAGTMSRTLMRLAEQSGLQLVYDATLTGKLSSPGLVGRYSPQEALAKLLEGTGLTYRFTDRNSVTIETTSKDAQARTLGPVRVEGADGSSAVNGINGSRDVTATEGTRSFTTGAMTIGSKSPRSIQDTPQSVSVITHERLEQQNINDFTKALEQAPGVSFEQGTTSLEHIFYSRGWQINSIQVDGGAPLTSMFGNSTGVAYFPLIDLSQYDHVEVLRGAAGLFNGYGDPSGTVNLVRKKPLDHSQVIVDAERGSWNHGRAVLDATSPLGFDDKLRGRLVVTRQDNEYFYRIAEDSKTMLYGTLEFDLAPTTLINVGASQTNQDSKPWYGGLPRYQTGEDLRLPRETGLIAPWSRVDLETQEIFGSIEQRFGEDWKVKLNVTQNEQRSTRKVAYSGGAVNPLNNGGPRLLGIYNDYGSDQMSAEFTLSGAFTLFGQRQEVTMGASRADQDGGGWTNYTTLISSSPAVPYQPYAGGPRYCYSTSASNPCPAGTIGPQTPPINVFAFNPFDPLYNEPANPLARERRIQLGQVQSLAYINLRLTAFDRLHLDTGVRWSRYEHKSANASLCSSRTVTPCVNRELGETYSIDSDFYSGETLSWPPAVSLSYDVTSAVTAYLGYTDIADDQSSMLSGDLDPLDPATGSNIELGFKWSARGGRLNTALAVYHVEKKGFGREEPNVMDRYRRNPDGSFYQDASGAFILVANNGRELPNGRLGPDLSCCYFRRQDETYISEGVDAELTGELLPGWQLAASYTFSTTETKGASFGAYEGQPTLTIQPEHLYKLWTTYDFGAAGATGWLANLSVSAGVNGQSKGYRSGSVCVNIGEPNPTTNISPCLPGGMVDYEFTVEPYAVASGRIGYRVNDVWSVALNLENMFDKVYYRSVGGVGAGNWYGAPRSYQLSVRSKW